MCPALTVVLAVHQKASILLLYIFISSSLLFGQLWMCCKDENKQGQNAAAHELAKQAIV